ncbi:MAG: helix-turn-helix domain-containing protein [Anaerolineae bacterium]|nr:helix-turn-helix domain-containing protein [Anaerolineae bacterium]
MNEILTVDEMAQYLKVSRSTIWRWCNQGKISAFKIGRGWRLHRSELEKIMGRRVEEKENPNHNGQY